MKRGIGVSARLMAASILICSLGVRPARGAEPLPVSTEIQLVGLTLEVILPDEFAGNRALILPRSTEARLQTRLLRNGEDVSALPEFSSYHVQGVLRSSLLPAEFPPAAVRAGEAITIPAAELLRARNYTLEPRLPVNRPRRPQLPPPNASPTSIAHPTTGARTEPACRGLE